jgi:uncharacterized protein (TIGR03435 family)
MRLKNRWVTLLWVCSVIMLSVVGTAQDAQFEAASLKHDDRNAPRVATNLDLDSTNYFRYQGGPVIADGYLINYLIFAYKIENAGEYRNLDASLPKWAQSQSSQTYRLEARTEDHPTKDSVRAMVRSLLAERFGLRVHTEIQQQLAWVLEKTSSGRSRTSQLRPHTGNPVCDTVPSDSKGAAGKTLPMCGPFVAFEAEGLHLTITDYTMPQTAGELTLMGERRGGMDELPGVDGTHMTGKFDLDLRFVSRTGSGASDEQTVEAGVDFRQALSTQAGLEFKKKTVPVEVLVVDHVDRPAPD